MDKHNIKPDEMAMEALETAYSTLKECKPKERGELARRYAVALTQLEQVIGYFQVFVLQEDHWPKEDE